MNNKLKVFITVAEQKNFTRASEILHMTPPAISLNIKSLEKQLGNKLFDRTNKYVKLTRAGEILYEHGKEILIKYAHIQHLLDDLKHGSHGTFNIGAAYTFGEYFLPNIIYSFNKLHPNIDPAITIQNSKSVVEMVQSQELDVGITVEKDVKGYPDIEVSLFSEDEMVIVVPPRHPLIQKKELDISLLESETWIVREKGSGTRNVTERLFNQLGIRPNKIMSFGSSQTIKESVELGIGISYLSEFIVRKEVLLGLLNSIRLKDYSNQGRFYLVTNKKKIHSRATTLFIEFLKTYSPHKNKPFTKSNIR